MNRSQEPSRSFFPFGNPFKLISPKGSQLSPRLMSLLNTFEQTLAERLRKLNPKDKSDVLGFAWMNLAMESICETHDDIKELITDLELPLCEWEGKWIDLYLDISVKLLDLCIAFSSELSRINQGHLLLQCVLHNLKSDTSEQFMKACASLDSWKHITTTKNPRVGNCWTILDSLVDSLDLPKVKSSAKGKVLMRAMYGVKVVTVYLCSVFTAVISSSFKKSLELNVPDTFLWAQNFSDLQKSVNGDIRTILSCKPVTVLKEMDAVDAIVKNVYPLIHEGVGASEVDRFKNSVLDLEEAAHKLSGGLDAFTKEVDCFFKIVLTGRDALLSNLRVAGNASEMPRSNVEQQAVR